MRRAAGSRSKPSGSFHNSYNESQADVLRYGLWGFSNISWNNRDPPRLPTAWRCDATLSLGHDPSKGTKGGCHIVCNSDGTAALYSPGIQGSGYPDCAGQGRGSEAFHTCNGLREWPLEQISGCRSASQMRGPSG